DSEYGAQQNRRRYHSPAELENFPDVSEGDLAGQRRAARLFRDPFRRAAVFRRSRTSTSIRRRIRSVSIVWNDTAGIHFRRFGDAAARSERRHHLRGEKPRAARAGAPLLAGFLA